MQTDGELVKAAINGDQRAFATLIERYERAVRAVGVQILPDLHMARDAAQETFVKAYKNLRSLRNSSAFGPWLLQIARREAITMARREPKSQYVENLNKLPAEQRDGQLPDQSRRLLTAVMKLPRHERNVVMLRHFDGLPVRTIAEMTGRNVSTVTKQLSRAHARLRKQLKELEL